MDAESGQFAIGAEGENEEKQTVSRPILAGPNTYFELPASNGWLPGRRRNIRATQAGRNGTQPSLKEEGCIQCRQGGVHNTGKDIGPDGHVGFA